MSMIDGYWCSICGQYHEGMPMDIAYTDPHPPILAAARERGEEIERSSDWCIVNNWQTCFVRTILDIPVHDGPKAFTYGVWVAVSPHYLMHLLDCWDTGVPDDEPRFVGYVGNQIDPYPDTLFLDVEMDARSATRRLSLTVVSPDHPLGIEQRTGITMARVQQLVETIKHPRP